MQDHQRTTDQGAPTHFTVLLIHSHDTSADCFVLEDVREHAQRVVTGLLSFKSPLAILQSPKRQSCLAGSLASSPPATLRYPVNVVRVGLAVLSPPTFDRTGFWKREFTISAAPD
jgi:hypothetical protein